MASLKVQKQAKIHSFQRGIFYLLQFRFFQTILSKFRKLVLMKVDAIRTQPVCE